MRAIATVIQALAFLGVIASSLYYLLCLWSARKFLQERAKPPSNESFLPPISVVKPVKGIDPEMYESLRTQCDQDYPEHEVIVGTNPSDPALDTIRKLMKQFRTGMVSVVPCSRVLGTNAKVSNLAQMLECASYSYLVVNDSDIRVERDYLRRVIAPLVDPRVGMVTCLYRGVASRTLGSRLEALGISTDFCPSVLAARQLEGGIRFGLGSTLAFRRADLEKIGGFEAIANYLADDYELGKRISDLGLSVQLSDVVVETFLPAYGFRDFLIHQLRWARGVRDARPSGYAGLIFTFGIFWAILALIASRGAVWAWIALAVTLVLRFMVATYVGGRVLRDPQAAKYSWLIPLRDFIAVGVWLVSLAGHTVTWRGDRFHLKNGKLTRIPP
jgi:ceramide glucosyltransferase